MPANLLRQELHIGTLMADKIKVDGKSISIKLVNEQEYISLTDMVKDTESPSTVIQNWMRTRATVNFLGVWENLNNPNFNHLEFEVIRNESGENTFTLSVKKWQEKVNGIGLQSKAGRYGGTYAHKDIAFDFGAWVSPSFRYLLIREFDRLKSEEFQRHKLEWDYTRYLSKINYDLQTESIKENIIPRLDPKDKTFIYADEADLLNLVVFGMTAKQWREQHPKSKGNMRDQASIAELTVLSNLESHNADLIRVGASKEARYLRLCEIAAFQFEVFKKRPDSYLLE